MRRLASTLLAGLVALGLASCAPAPKGEGCREKDERGLIVPPLF